MNRWSFASPTPKDSFNNLKGGFPETSIDDTRSIGSQDGLIHNNTEQTNKRSMLPYILGVIAVVVVVIIIYIVVVGKDTKEHVISPVNDPKQNTNDKIVSNDISKTNETEITNNADRRRHVGGDIARGVIPSAPKYENDYWNKPVTLETKDMYLSQNNDTVLSFESSIYLDKLISPNYNQSIITMFSPSLDIRTLKLYDAKTEFVKANYVTAGLDKNFIYNGTRYNRPGTFHMYDNTHQSKFHSSIILSTDIPNDSTGMVDSIMIENNKQILENIVGMAILSTTIQIGKSNRDLNLYISVIQMRQFLPEGRHTSIWFIKMYTDMDVSSYVKRRERKKDKAPGPPVPINYILSVMNNIVDMIIKSSLLFGRNDIADVHVFYFGLDMYATQEVETYTKEMVKMYTFIGPPETHYRPDGIKRCKILCSRAIVSNTQINRVKLEQGTLTVETIKSDNDTRKKRNAEELYYDDNKSYTTEISDTTSFQYFTEDKSVLVDESDDDTTSQERASTPDSDSQFNMFDNQDHDS